MLHSQSSIIEIYIKCVKVASMIASIIAATITASMVSLKSLCHEECFQAHHATHSVGRFTIDFPFWPSNRLCLRRSVNTAFQVHVIYFQHSTSPLFPSKHHNHQLHGHAIFLRSSHDDNTLISTHKAAASNSSPPDNNTSNHGIQPTSSDPTIPQDPRVHRQYATQHSS